MRMVEQLSYTNPDSEKIVSDYMKRCGGNLEDFSVILRKLGYSLPYEIRLLSGTTKNHVVGLIEGQMSIMLSFYDEPGEERKISIYHYGSSIDYYLKATRSSEYGTTFRITTKKES